MITNSLGLHPSQCSNLSSRFPPMNNGHFSDPRGIDPELTEDLFLSSPPEHDTPCFSWSCRVTQFVRSMTHGRSWRVPAGLVFIGLLTLIPSTAEWVPTGLQAQVLLDRSSQSSPSFIPKHSLEVLRRVMGETRDYCVSNI